MQSSTAKTTNDNKSDKLNSKESKHDGSCDDDEQQNKSIEEGEIIESFDQLDLKDNLLRGIYAHGFEKPSPIQQVQKNKVSASQY